MTPITMQIARLSSQTRVDLAKLRFEEALETLCAEKLILETEGKS